MGRITTHVLDTARGCPAAGLRVKLFHLGEARLRLADMLTNADGRVDDPLVAGDAFVKGEYEIHFLVGDYLRENGSVTGELPFLDIIPIRFGIADPSQHFHVPLLLSPFGYSTYRGS